MTYAAWRRRFAVGTRFTVEHELDGTMRQRYVGDDGTGTRTFVVETVHLSGVRVVTKVQANAIVSQWPEDDPEERHVKGGSWLHWPKAAEVEVLDDDAVRFGDTPGSRFIYRITS